nr:disease resistance protein [Tanacetum cinerariifolium]
MADTFTSALVTDVVGRLTSKVIQEYGLLRGLKNDLSALENTFKQIQGVLYDAEMKQTKQKDVEEWLRTLKSASLEDLLIELWMANGFIPSQGNLSLYELGEEIFSCLVRRSFFHDVVEEDIYTCEKCKMHDLMHDLALYAMGHACTVIEPGKELIISDEVLHLILSCPYFEFSKHDLKKLRSVRSMLVFNVHYTSNIRQISNHVYLRVLYLQGIRSTLPESVCKLIHLRYLNISGSNIEVLPEWIINLQNLQVLIIECQELRELPKGLRYMRNLQRLDTGRRCEREKGEDWPKLSHIPHLFIERPRPEGDDNDENEG